MVKVAELRKLLEMVMQFLEDFEGLDKATQDEWWALHSHADRYSEFIAEKIKEAEEYELV